VPQTHSMYTDTTVVVAQAGYNTVQELAAMGTPSVLVPIPAAAGLEDDQEGRATARQGARGVYVADPDPDDIASGILAVLDTPLTPATIDTGPGQRGASQIATVLEVLSEA
jgi:UDP-N-acetylglucosamine:LPS N-acetylglucosamine transferase